MYINSLLFGYKIDEALIDVQEKKYFHNIKHTGSVQDVTSENTQILPEHELVVK